MNEKVNQALEIAKTLCELTPTKEEKDLIVSALKQAEENEKELNELKKENCR